MKQIALVLLFGTAATLPASGQRVPDPDATAVPSMAHYYYQNSGQLLDDSGQVRTDILYYTEHTTPSIFLKENGVSFVAYKPALDSVSEDSSFRIDMQFICQTEISGIICGSLQTYEQSHDYLNYYLPHCPNGVTDVYGYSGVMYQNAFPQTDFHCYSDQLGFKSYVVFRPGSDPTRFLLKFTGQDSIAATASLIELYLNGAGLPLAVTEVYTVDPATNVITPLSWLPVWRNYGNGQVEAVPTGPYNTSEELVYKLARPQLRTTASNGNMDWCTFYGGSGAESYPCITSNAKNELYHVMAQAGGKFPYYQGKSPAALGPRNIGNRDCYVTKFDSSQVRQWATYIGGTGRDLPFSICNSDDWVHGQIANLFIAGETSSRDLPLGSNVANFRKTKFGGGFSDGFLLGLYNNNGQLNYGTYYGGGDGAPQAREAITALAIDDNLNLYFCGYTHSTLWDSSSNNPDSSKFPLRRTNPSQFFQAGKINTLSSRDGFIGKLQLVAGSLRWSTYFGGEENDEFHHIVHSTATGSPEIYVVGRTESPGTNGPWTSPTSVPPVSGKLPLSDPSGSADYFQYVAANTGQASTVNGLITHFNNSDALDWCTFFGGTGYEDFTEAAVNSNGDLYIIGSAGETMFGPMSVDSTNSNVANNAGKLPYHFDLLSHKQYPWSEYPGWAEGDDLIVRFNSSHQLRWATCFGGKGDEGRRIFGSSGWSSLPESPLQELKAHIVIDNTDNVYIGASTTIPRTNISSTNEDIIVRHVNGRYNQPHQAAYGYPYGSTMGNLWGGGTLTDGYLAQFRPNNSLKWATHFGGVQPSKNQGDKDTNNFEAICGLAVGKKSPARLYFTGFTMNNTTPNQPLSGPNVYNQPVYGTHGDVFIGRFTNAAFTSVNEVSASKSGNMLVYPNPSSGRYDISLTAHGIVGISKAKLQVYNCIGQLVHFQNISLDEGRNDYSFDISSMAPGIYIVQIASGDLAESIRISKM